MRLKLGGVLSDTNPVQFVPHTQFLQDRHVKRQQRFADVKSRMFLFVQHRDIAALLRQYCADRRSRRTAANNENLAMARRFRDVNDFQSGHKGGSWLWPSRQQRYLSQMFVMADVRVYFHVIAPSTLIT